MILSPEEVAARTGIDAGLLRETHAHLNDFLRAIQADTPQNRRLFNQFVSGRMADVQGFDWYMDPEKP